MEIVRWLFIIASRLRMEIDECNVMLMSSSLTLKYLINVGVRLLFFCQFSSRSALVSYLTFIKYGPNFHPTCLLHSRINWSMGNLTKTLVYEFKKVKMFIDFQGNIHLTPLFHTLRLLGTQEYLNGLMKSKSSFNLQLRYPLSKLLYP